MDSAHRRVETTRVYFVFRDGQIIPTKLTHVPREGELVNFWRDNPPGSAFRVTLVSWHYRSSQGGSENHVYVHLA